MTELSPRDRVYLLARSQNDYIPVRTAVHSPEGFADGRDTRGRRLRWVTCPDCLTNGRTMPGCETCKGRGEIPDDNPDPMRIRDTGQAGFYGTDHREKHDRARAIDGQILRLQLVTDQRDGKQDPEDWLERCRRLHAAQARTGDYRLLEHAQDRLGWQNLRGHFLWMRAVVDGLPVAPATGPVLDGLADWLADWILAAIACERLDQQFAAARLGVRRPRLRPETIVIPAHLELPDMAGKGRWANTQSQGQRNGMIIALHHEGHTAGTIARRVGLTKRRVQQLLADVTVATGPAAA